MTQTKGRKVLRLQFGGVLTKSQKNIRKLFVCSLYSNDSQTGRLICRVSNYSFSVVGPCFISQWEMIDFLLRVIFLGKNDTECAVLLLVSKNPIQVLFVSPDHVFSHERFGCVLMGGVRSKE